MTLNYDEPTVARILAAVLDCPEEQRMDSFAAATDVFVRGVCKPLVLRNEATTGATP